MRTATEDDKAIEAQRIKLNEYTAELAAGENEVNVQEFVDVGYDGTNLDRPALTDLIALASTGSLDLIVMTDETRISLDYVDAREIIASLEEHAVVDFTIEPHLLVEAGGSVDAKRMINFAKTYHDFYNYIINHKLNNFPKKDDNSN